MNHSDTAVAKELYTTLVKELGDLPGVTQWEKKRFGSRGLSIHDKIFAMLLKDKLVVKLPKARVDELIERRVGEHFELGQKRMKEWVTISTVSGDNWLPLSREAIEFVASGL